MAKDPGNPEPGMFLLVVVVLTIMLVLLLKCDKGPSEKNQPPADKPEPLVSNGVTYYR